jgi:uncharacterized membrane protein
MVPHGYQKIQVALLGSLLLIIGCEVLDLNHWPASPSLSESSSSRAASQVITHHTYPWVNDAVVLRPGSRD